jgi:catechol-2,3-dioxygenase
LPNGSSFYIPEADIDLGTTLDMDNESQETFANFMAWVENYNTYILNEWNEKMHKNEEVDTETVEAFVDIDLEDFV